LREKENTSANNNELNFEFSPSDIRKDEFIEMSAIKPPRKRKIEDDEMLQ
jgi:hypothetical protein